MADRLSRYEAAGDNRAVFQRVYLLMTREMARRLAASFFGDRVWVERVLVGFADYYVDALDAYDAGEPCPPAWRLALDAARDRRTFVLEDALLGINAHINNDLPFVLAGILATDGAWPDARLMLRRRLDHDRVNEILLFLVDLVQRELTRHYARLTSLADRALGRRDECLSGFLMAHCRANVWHFTELLLDASDDETRAAVRDRIEREAFDLALRVHTSPLFRVARPAARLSRRYRLL
jgi:hypothetical protein